MIGKTISHYEILEKLGEGGMGVVYKAEDTKLKRNVALKFLPPELTRDAEAKKRFIHEAQAASALDHTNICTIYEIDETEEGQTYIAMACYDGETLKNKIERGPLKINDAVNLAIQIGEGLKEAHEKGIVHRDVKSANIMVIHEAKVKILDFGLAKLTGRTMLTKTGTTMGTMGYMSPEQCRGDKVDQRTDIWSLGVVLYEMLTGKRPFQGDYDQAVMYAIINDVPEPVTSFRTGIPLELERIIQKALTKELSSRYQNVVDLLVDLRQIKQQSLSKEAEVLRLEKESKRIINRRFVLIPTSLIVLALILYSLFRFGFLNQLAEETLGPPSWENSIVVLPFTDMSPEKDQAYFCDGMTEDLITRLCSIDGLKVIARTSAFRYKSTNKDVKEVARELGVATVLEGSIQKERERIRVNVQLINGNDASHIWADLFDENVESVFDVQDRVTSAIARELQLQFRPESNQQHLRQPVDFEMYDYYLKGMHFIKTKYTVSLDEKDYETGIRMFQKAIAIDSTYARAYVGLFWAHYHHYVNYGDIASRNLSYENIKHAYALDPGDPLTIVSMGLRSAERNEHEDAARYFRQAIQLNLNLAEIHQTIGYVLLKYGLCQKALKYLQRSIELDPYYIWARAHLANSLVYLGRREEAEIYFRKNIELDPIDTRHFLYYAEYCIQEKKYDKAAELIEHAEELKSLNPDFPRGNVTYYYALLYAAKEEKSKALEMYSRPSGKLYSLLEMKEEAITCLENSSMKTQASNYWELLNSPFYELLREDPRFQEILKKEKQRHNNLLSIYRGL
jgi:serine/threonine protein kinase/Flp pilus assembly protein TadD